MSDVGTDAEPRAADAAPRSERGGGVRVPRSRGVVSGVVLLLAGVWAALVPFVGPSFHFAYTPKPHETWHWTAARGWFEVLPGGLAAFGGLLLILSANRILTSLGAWLAVLAGGWLVVGQQVSYLLTLGSPGAPSAAGDRRYVAEYLAFFTGIGALIVLFGALAAGRLSVRSVRDVRAAARRDEQAALADQEAADRDAAERDQYERAAVDRAATDRNADSWAAGAAAGGYGTPGTTEPLPVAPAQGEFGRSASAVTTELPVAGRDDERFRRLDAAPEDDTAALPVLSEGYDRTPEPEPEPLPRAERPSAPESQPAREAPEPVGQPAPEPEAAVAPETAPAPGPVAAEPEPVAEHEPQPEPEPSAPPLVLEPPAGHPDAPRPLEPPAPSGGASVWNPEAQSPTTTGELPTLGAEPAGAPGPVASPSTPDVPTEPAVARRGVQAPRRYFGAGTAEPSDVAPAEPSDVAPAELSDGAPAEPSDGAGTAEPPVRDAVRPDEADDLDDLDLDEPTR